MTGKDLVEAVLTGGYRRCCAANIRRGAGPGRATTSGPLCRGMCAISRRLRSWTRCRGCSRFLPSNPVSSPISPRWAARLDLTTRRRRKYVAILEQLFLVRRLEPWFRNRLKRLIKTPKIHFLDSGLLATLLGATAEGVRKDRAIFGRLLETFVFSEVLKQMPFMETGCTLYHYRDKDQDEVDIVIEDSAGALVGIEVKAGATVNSGDFKGLRKMADASGDDFKLGLALYDGERAVPFGNRLFAAPLSCLWG